jgi:hypothetical protein
MSLTLLEDAADSAGGGVLFVAEAPRVVGRRRCHPTW